MAVIDSGILPSHPDFAGKLVPGYDFFNRDSNPTDPSGSFHGSHVAGMVAAASNNGVGVAGVSWSSRILPVKVLDSDFGTLGDVIDGILWSVGKAIPGAPNNVNRAQVLNMSLGGDVLCSDVPALQEAINKANATGAVVVAGNNNDNAKGFMPASCNGVISVGATNYPGERAYYSNYGSRIDVMAPGGDATHDRDSNGDVDGVLSTIWDSATSSYNYGNMQGTSMAAPHVAGVIALMKSVKPSLTWTQARDILKGTAHPISHSSCLVGCGAGLIDAAAALKAVASPSTYAVNFTSSNVPTGKVVSSVALGRGITSSGKITSNVDIYAKRSGLSGNMAMVRSTARHLIISKDGSSQTSYAKGDYMDFKFSSFGTTGRVEVKTLKVKNTTTTSGTVKVYRGTTLLKTLSVPRTGSGVTKTQFLNVSNASLVKVTLTGPGAVDDLVVTTPQ